MGKMNDSETNRLIGELPWNLAGIAQNEGDLESILAAAEAWPAAGFAMILRDPERRTDRLRKLADAAERSGLPQNVTLIGNGIDLKEYWRHLTSSDVRSGVRTDRPFGCSAHTREEILAAAELGASYLLLGTIYETPSKPGLGGAGVTLIRESVSLTDIPIIAIGGVSTPQQARECLDAGAAGVAGISLFRPDRRSELEEVVEVLAEHRRG